MISKLCAAAVEVTLELETETDRQTPANAAGYCASRVFVVPCSTIEPGVAMEVPLF